MEFCSLVSLTSPVCQLNVTKLLYSWERVSLPTHIGCRGHLYEYKSRDGNIRYYEWESGSLYPLSEYKSTEPQRGMCFLPRRALAVSECEIARAYKVSGTGFVEPIAFIVPRRVRVYISYQSGLR
jgi:hypothetical protein